MQYSSEFLDNNTNTASIGEAWKLPFAEGATSICYKEYHGGRLYLRKSLKEEYLTQQRYRNTYRKEYTIGTALDCPYIVKYNDFINTPEECSLLMDFVEGNTLDVFLADNPTYFNNKEELKTFCCQLLQVLDYLHQRQILHLDLKPENIIITTKSHDVKVIDLGFCYSDSFQDTVGTTEEYAAHELLDGSFSFDVRTDIYSFGKILETINSHSPLPQRFAKVMQRCLAANKDERYQNVAEVRAALCSNCHHLRTTLITLVSITIAVFAFITFNGPRAVHHAINGYDFHFENLCYDVVSDDSLTCRVVGFYNTKDGSINNVTIRPFVPYKGENYTIVAVADTALTYQQSIKSISILSSRVKIGNGAFGHCENLTAISFPDSIHNLGFSVLNSCVRLNTIRFPENVAVIPQGFFHHTGLEHLSLPEGVITIMQDAFCDCDSLYHIQLPSTLNTLGRGTFFSCERIEEITIPESVRSIGDYCFYGCTSLKRVYNNSPQPQNVIDLFDDDSEVTIFVPRTSLELYRKATYWSTLNIQPAE